MAGTTSDKIFSIFLIILILAIIVIGSVFTSSYTWVANKIYTDAEKRKWSESGIMVGGIGMIVAGVVLTLSLRDKMYNPWSSKPSITFPTLN